VYVRFAEDELAVPARRLPRLRSIQGGSARPPVAVVQAACQEAYSGIREVVDVRAESGVELRASPGLLAGPQRTAETAVELAGVGLGDLVEEGLGHFAALFAIHVQEVGNPLGASGFRWRTEASEIRNRPVFDAWHFRVFQGRRWIAPGCPELRFVSVLRFEELRENCCLSGADVHPEAEVAVRLAPIAFVASSSYEKADQALSVGLGPDMFYEFAQGARRVFLVARRGERRVELAYASGVPVGRIGFGRVGQVARAPGDKRPFLGGHVRRQRYVGPDDEIRVRAGYCQLAHQVVHGLEVGLA
jgi:hypothetical protein